MFLPHKFVAVVAKEKTEARAGAAVGWIGEREKKE